MKQEILAGPFRAETVGSFLRPNELTYMRNFYLRGKLSSEELRMVENEAIRNLVERQHEAGLKTATDGEFRRHCWHQDFFWGLMGIERLQHQPVYRSFDGVTESDSSRMVGRIAFNPAHPFLNDYSWLHSVTPMGMQPRIDLPAPSRLYTEMMNNDNEMAVFQIYGNRYYDLADDIALSYRQTLMALYDRGCRHVKLDDNPIRPSEIHAYVNRTATENLPNDLTISLHLFRYPKQEELTDEGYALMLNNVNARAFFLDPDDVRMLHHVPEGKRVVLGVLDSSNPVTHTREEIVQRIRQAAEYLPLQQLCISPKSGFYFTGHAESRMNEDEQWRQISLMQEIANEELNKMIQCKKIYL